MKDQLDSQRKVQGKCQKCACILAHKSSYLWCKSVQIVWNNWKEFGLNYFILALSVLFAKAKFMHMLVILQ